MSTRLKKIILSIGFCLGLLLSANADLLGEWTFNAGTNSAERRGSSNLDAGVADLSVLEFNTFDDVGIGSDGSQSVPNSVHDGLGFGSVAAGGTVAFVHRANYFDGNVVPPKESATDFTSFGSGTAQGTTAGQGDGNAPISFTVTAGLEPLQVDSLTITTFYVDGMLFGFQEAGATVGVRKTCSSANLVQTALLNEPVIVGAGQTKTFTISLSSGLLDSKHQLDNIALNGATGSTGGYAMWAAGWGVDIGAETADPDGDGLSNLYEYGLGGDPTDVLDQGISPVCGVEDVGGTNYFGYIHPQLAADQNSGLNYFLELNTNLVSGIWTPFGHTVTGTNVTGGELDFVTNVTDMVDDIKFARLSIVETGSASELRALILQNRPLPLTHLDIATHLNVADFGAVPNDGQDDRVAVSAAVAQAKALAGPVQIDFGLGTYDFFATEPEFSMTLGNAAIPLQDCENLILDGQGAEVVIHRQDVSFSWVYRSTNLIVRNFSIDYDPLPFSQGVVSQILPDGTGFLLELDAGFPAPNHSFFSNFDSWGMLKDATHPGRLKADVPSFFRYEDILLESNNLFRVQLLDTNNISYFEEGDAFVINGRSAGIGRYGLSENITFDRITVYACPGSLFIGSQTSRLNVLNCNGKLKGNRLIVSGSDGVHCQSARIGPWIENCDFEGLSDDCLNIYGLPIYVLEQLSPTQMTVYARASILPGDRLAFFDPNAGRIMQETTVVSFSGNTLVLSDPVEEMNIAPQGTPIATREWKIYDHAYNLDTIGNHFVYRNNHMHDGRRYGILIKASYGLVEGNVFEGLSGTGMVLQNSPDWPEGFWAQNLIIQSNRVSECGYGNSDPCVSVSSLKLTGFMESPIQKNLYFINNSFNAVIGPAMELSGVSNLVAEGNTFTSGSPTGPLITIQYSEDVTLINNQGQDRVEFQ